MGIKKLKKENDFLNISVIDMLGKLDTSKTKKYTQFLVKMINKDRKNFDDDHLPDISNRENNPLTQTLPRDSYTNNMIRNFLDYAIQYENSKIFVEFTQLMERGLVDENDISKYDSWDMLHEQTFKAKNREILKNSKKVIHTIYEDDDYLIFKPLTYLTSVTYGYQTKWCTAMIDNPNYFYNHSLGVLIYLIDKKNTKKFAFHKSISYPGHYFGDSPDSEMIKTYNESDKQIDTFQTGLPYDIIKIVSDNISDEGNYKLFSEDELTEMRKHTQIPGENIRRGLRVVDNRPLDRYFRDEVQYDDDESVPVPMSEQFSYDESPVPMTTQFSYGESPVPLTEQFPYLDDELP